MKKITKEVQKLQVGLVGNPNAGKTSLFNLLTGLNQKVGNYPGVTVDKKTGTSWLNEKVEAKILDLPGTYSIYPRAYDEKIVFETLSNPQKNDFPDVVVMIIDATNLKRHLLLYTQLADLGLPIIIVLNMIDLAKKAKLDIDTDKLQQKLQVPVIAFNARKGEGLDLLKKHLIKASNIEKQNTTFYKTLPIENTTINEVKIRFNLKNDYLAYQYLQQTDNLTHITYEDKIWLEEKATSFDKKKAQAQETILRYTQIKHLLEDTLQNTKTINNSITTKLDKILTHKIGGYLIFLAILLLMFQTIFSLATYPMEWIELGFLSLNDFFQSIIPESFFKELLTEGIIPGLQGVVIFVPQIALLFTFIAILEETGYMARIVFLMDKMMQKIGLNGKSVVPLISGAACAIPAIMATRGISNWKERMITILVTPFMSCSARLPVYTILIAFTIPQKYVFGIFNLKGLTLLALYLIGVLAAVLTSFILQLIVKNKGSNFFAMEMPTYKAPRWKNIALTAYEKSKTFVLVAGKIILLIAIILWALSYYGPNDKMQQAETVIAHQHDTTTLTSEQIESYIKTYKLENSYAGILGKTIEPLIKPLGYDWKIGIAIITSFAAREVFVGTMATLYSLGDTGNTEKRLSQKLKNEINPKTGQPVFTTAVSLSLLVFYALAMQCMSTLAVVYRETKSWKWPIIQLVYMTGVAYLAALLVYNIFS